MMFYTTEDAARAVVRVLNANFRKGDRVYSHRHNGTCWVVYLTHIAVRRGCAEPGSEGRFPRNQE
jgi:hypothetical protein